MNPLRVFILLLLLLKKEILATHSVTIAVRCPRRSTEIEHAAFASLWSYFDYRTTCAHTLDYKTITDRVSTRVGRKKKRFSVNSIISNEIPFFFYVFAVDEQSSGAVCRTRVRECFAGVPCEFRKVSRKSPIDRSDIRVPFKNLCRQARKYSKLIRTV